MNAVIRALLPLIVTLALGFFAAWRHEFSHEQALVLNRVVLLYALPLLFFAGTVTITRGTLTGSLGLAAAITAAMVGAYPVTFLVVRLALHRPLGVSAVTALAIGGPAVPFAGVVVLGYLYRPSVSAVPVAVGALVFNVIEVPVTLVLLPVAAGSSAAATGTPPRIKTPAVMVRAYAGGASEKDGATRVEPASARILERPGAQGDLLDRRCHPRRALRRGRVCGSGHSETHGVFQHPFDRAEQRHSPHGSGCFVIDLDDEVMQRIDDLMADALPVAGPSPEGM
jgi:hypothetical protein